MADEPNGAGQVPADPQSSSTTDPAQTAGQVPSTSAPSDPTTPADATTPPKLTLEQALDALDKARKEAAKNRVDGKLLAELQAAKKAADDAQLTETQRLQKNLADLQVAQAEAQRKAQERIIRAEVRAHAASVGIPHELAGRLIDYAEIEYDDDGEPTNIGKLLDKLVKAYPQLVPAKNGAQNAPPQPTSVGATPGNPARSGAHSGAITREYLDSLTPRQYAELPATRRQEILQWLSANGGALRSS